MFFKENKMSEKNKRTKRKQIKWNKKKRQENNALTRT